MSDDSTCIAVWQGRLPYRTALDLQMSLCNFKKQGYGPDVLLLLEHPPTITLGRNGRRQNLLAGEADLRRRGVELWDVDRGGDITYHGPGQLVGYPILALGRSERDVHRYMRNLEESLIRVLAGFGIQAGRNERFTGVWTPEGKVAAMGVHISRWITRHGFALNVSTDLSFYDLIVPCGIVGKGVTTMERQLGRPIEVSEVASAYVEVFGDVFDRRMARMDVESFNRELAVLKKPEVSTLAPSL